MANKEETFLKYIMIALGVGMGIYALSKSGLFRGSLPSPYQNMIEFIDSRNKPQAQQFPQGDIRNDLSYNKRMWIA